RSTGERMRIVAWQDRDRAGLERCRRHAFDFDDQPARANVMIADQRLRDGEERREMVRRELRQDAEVAAELAVDHHSAGQAQRAENVVEHVHLLPPPAYVCGVSINLSGT